MGFEAIKLAKTAKMAVEVLLSVKPGENVCIATDTNKLSIAQALAEACYAVGAETVVCIMTPRQIHGEEIPPVLAGAMKAAQVVIAPTSYALTHTRGRLAASAAGARILIIREVTEDTFVNGAAAADYEDIYAVTSRIVERFDAASEIRMVTALGSDIRMSIAGRNGLGLPGLVCPPAWFSSFPSGEAAISPVEGTAEGTIVVDHGIDSMGLLNEPIKITVKKGRVVSVSGGAQAKHLEKLTHSDEYASTIAEFAIGTNPLSRMLGNIAEDKILKGCVHIAIGDNHTIGGETESCIHLDMVTLKPTVWLDDDKVVDEGVLCL
ncbi:aminopeptidase [Chloroflexota bacterium]